MILQTFSYSRTAQPKQYESVKIEATAAPSDAQSTLDAFAELVGFVDAEVEQACARVASGNGAPKGGKKAPTKANPTPAAPLAASLSSVSGNLASTGESAAQTTPAKAEAPPFDDGQPIKQAEPAPAKTRKPRKSKADLQANMKSIADVSKEVNYVLESETLEELAERFNNFRAPTSGFVASCSVDQWEQYIDAICGRYRQLNSATANHETQQTIIAAGKAERTFIANQRQEASVAA